MNAIEIREMLINALNPTYERKFGWTPSKNVYNISSLTHGAKAFLAMRERAPMKGFNRHLVRGSAIDELVKVRLEEWDSSNDNVLKWTLPYTWKNPTLHDILLIGHYDLFKDDTILEVKAPESEERFIQNGSMLRARRQVAAYATMKRLKMGKPIRAFIVTINSNILVSELSTDEIEHGWADIRKTAYEVAKELDK